VQRRRTQLDATSNEREVPCSESKRFSLLECLEQRRSS